MLISDLKHKLNVLMCQNNVSIIPIVYNKLLVFNHGICHSPAAWWHDSEDIGPQILRGRRLVRSLRLQFT